MSKDFIQALWNMPSQPPAVNLPSIVNPSQVEGRVIVVTGANIGLGFEAAKHFARLKPARLVLGCRNEEKGEHAVQELKRVTGFELIELRLLDLANFASVVAFADGIANDIGRVDLLILNAGMANAHFETSKDGHEIVLQTNNLGPELLALLLLPTIRKTEQENSAIPKPRIVTVGSNVYAHTSLDEDLVNHSHILKRMSEADYCNEAVIERRYSDTKLFNVWFSQSLQDYLKDSKSGIIVNSLSPGLCITNFLSNMPEEHKQAMEEVTKAKAYSAEEGSRFIIQAALALAGDGVKEMKLQGAYFSFGNVKEVSDFAKSEVGKRVQVKLWNETLDELSKVDNRVRDVVVTRLL